MKVKSAQMLDRRSTFKKQSHVKIWLSFWKWMEGCDSHQTSYLLEAKIFWMMTVLIKILTMEESYVNDPFIQNGTLWRLKIIKSSATMVFKWSCSDHRSWIWKCFQSQCFELCCGRPKSWTESAVIQRRSNHGFLWKMITGWAPMHADAEELTQWKNRYWRIGGRRRRCWKLELAWMASQLRWTWSVDRSWWWMKAGVPMIMVKSGHGYDWLNWTIYSHDLQFLFYFTSADIKVIHCLTRSIAKMYYGWLISHHWNFLFLGSCSYDKFKGLWNVVDGFRRDLRHEFQCAKCYQSARHHNFVNIDNNRNLQLQGLDEPAWN